MNVAERVQKLEALLARVKANAAQPRTPGDVMIAAAAAPAVADDVDDSRDTSVPPTNAFTPEEEAAVAEAGYDDVEVSAEVVEVDIDVDDAEVAEALASEAAEAEDVTTFSAPPPAAELEVVEGAKGASVPPPRPANEIEEPEPSSSPRPIVEAHEPQEVPRHTPPPESGKQVAASTPPQQRAPSFPPPARAPSLEPPPVSEPPPSLEGHTLIGGWREPGLGQAPAQGGSSPLGVRVPAAGAPPPPVSRPAAATPPTVGASPGATGDFTGPKPARTAPAAAASPVSPEITRPELATGARVATFEGRAPAFAPATFGELLDATLDL